MAWVLGGEHEIYCGLYPYDAQYHNLDSFRRNFVSDYQIAQAKTDLDLDYGYVSVYLKKDSLLFKATVEGNHLDTVWVNMTDKDVGLVEGVLTQAKKIYANSTVFERRYPCPLAWICCKEFVKYQCEIFKGVDLL